MTVRNISGTYALNDGTILPGYGEESRFLGMNSSTSQLSGFVFGQQGYDIFGKSNGYSISNLATENDWLIRNENLNTQYATTHTANLTMRATLEPFKDVNIDLNLNEIIPIIQESFIDGMKVLRHLKDKANFKPLPLLIQQLLGVPFY